LVINSILPAKKVFLKTICALKVLMRYIGYRYSFKLQKKVIKITYCILIQQALGQIHQKNQEHNNQKGFITFILNIQNKYNGKN